MVVIYIFSISLLYITYYFTKMTQLDSIACLLLPQQLNAVI